MKYFKEWAKIRKIPFPLRGYSIQGCHIAWGSFEFGSFEFRV